MNDTFSSLILILHIVGYNMPNFLGDHNYLKSPIFGGK